MKTLINLEKLYLWRKGSSDKLWKLIEAEKAKTVATDSIDKETIKELKKEVDSLKAEVKKLKAELAKLNK